jgi:hypothetical protein
MNSVERYKPATNFNPDCPDLMPMAERELSAFFHAVTESFGSEQADLSAEDWLHELIAIDALPTSAREWRLITAKVSTRLPGRANASSPSSLSAEFTNA